ncbi:MAG: SDR family NAD(P)-dependent oxidoreductase [Polymorphobacter sp.]|uniref:SDR family NAD(P)-dependent oxidoreductase n=1 Tax=Polymorphobacter sp. TaxID=1909290 RepID=UPI003A8ACEFB
MTITDKPLALVTGASRGIGAATAVALARAGHHVIITARKDKDLETVDDAIAEAGGTATIAPFDLTDNPAIERLAAALAGRWGRLDVLVLNAAQLGSLAPVPHIDTKDWDRVLAVNLTANWHLIRALDPLLRRAGAAEVVALTSSVGSQPRAYWGAYAASKAGLENLIATYALETAPVSAIRTHIIDPGATRTAMRARAFPGEDPAGVKPPEEVAAKILTAIDSPR